MLFLYSMLLNPFFIYLTCYGFHNLYEFYNILIHSKFHIHGYIEHVMDFKIYCAYTCYEMHSYIQYIVLIQHVVKFIPIGSFLYIT